jgi:hypothetical protein
MEYSVDNPYAPGGVLYESWEDKRSRDGALGSSTVKGVAVGAAGGAVQWMNRLWDLPETAGLMAAAPGWT